MNTKLVYLYAFDYAVKDYIEDTICFLIYSRLLQDKMHRDTHFDHNNVFPEYPPNTQTQIEQIAENSHCRCVIPDTLYF